MQLEKPWPCCLSRDLAGRSPAPLRNTLRKLFQQPPPRRDNSISPSSCHPCSCHPCSLECLQGGGAALHCPEAGTKPSVCKSQNSTAPSRIPPGSVAARGSVLGSSCSWSLPDTAQSSWTPGRESWAQPGHQRQILSCCIHLGNAGFPNCLLEKQRGRNVSSGDSRLQLQMVSNLEIPSERAESGKKGVYFNFHLI